MELKINPRGERMFEALIISDQRGNLIVNSAKDWLKNEMKTCKEFQPSTLDFAKYCASISENLEEYTLLIMRMDVIIENSMEELHEEICPQCRIKRENEEKAEKRSDKYGAFAFRGAKGVRLPGAEEIAPGIFVIGI